VYTITTYSGSTSLGSNEYTKTCSIPSSVKPSCTVTVTDPTGYFDNYGAFIKGLSKFKVVVTPETAQGSPIASYSTTANGSTYTDSSFITDVLKTSGTLTVKATVKDKRGRTGTVSVSKTVLEYIPPVINKLVVGRCNEDGTENDKGAYCKVVFSASASNLNNQNSVTYRLYYRKTSETTAERKDFTEYKDVYSVEDVTYIFPADTGSSYVVTLHVIDNFNVEKPTFKTTSVSTGFTLMHWSIGGTGMGIGKIAEEEGLLDIGIPVRFREGVTNNLLWSGEYFMTSGHTIELSQPISKQNSGIVLVFSAYEDGQPKNHHFESSFIPKYLVNAMEGGGHNCKLCTSDFSYIGTKYLYISDTSIKGHDNNNKTGTANGVTYTNGHWVLRYVIGV
jgi:hypothetical protein